MYLFFDTETTGLPRNWNAPSSATGNWPRMVQLALLVHNDRATLLKEYNFIIQPDGYTISDQAARIHGITTQRAREEGVPLPSVLETFRNLLDECKYLIAHNVDFDEKVLGAEYYRIEKVDPMVGYPKICTMKDRRVVKYCALRPKQYGHFKWPKLSQLHSKLFGEDFEDAHNAAADVSATAKCFWELRRRGVL